MSFFKHIGTANGNKKVIILQRELPGEAHMASVIFSEIIPGRLHDDLMKELESDAGQAADEFRSVLERRFFSDGRNMLEGLHSDGYVKKVASNNVVVRPNSKSSVKLDELNQLLRDIRTGKSAASEMAKMETAVENMGYADAPAPVAAAPAMDQMSMMMEMMKTMQSLQAEVAAMKGGSEPKKGRGRPAKNSA